MDEWQQQFKEAFKDALGYSQIIKNEEDDSFHIIEGKNGIAIQTKIMENEIIDKKEFTLKKIESNSSLFFQLFIAASVKAAFTAKDKDLFVFSSTDYATDGLISLVGDEDEDTMTLGMLLCYATVYEVSQYSAPNSWIPKILKIRETHKCLKRHPLILLSYEPIQTVAKEFNVRYFNNNGNFKEFDGNLCCDFSKGIWIISQKNQNEALIECIKLLEGITKISGTTTYQEPGVSCEATFNSRFSSLKSAKISIIEGQKDFEGQYYYLHMTKENNLS